VTVAGMIVAAALAAYALLAPTVRGRAWAILGALALTPVLLVAEIWDTPQLETLRDRPALSLSAAAVALVAVGALAVLFARRPAALAVLAPAALPFRIPIEVGGETASLLVPLYGVIGAGALAYALPRLRHEESHLPPRPTSWMKRVLGGLLVLYALQATYSSDQTKALEQVVFFYVPFALLFAVLRELDWTPRRLTWAFRVLLAEALIFAGIGFWEYFTRELLLNPKVIASNQVREYFRVNSLFFDPNIYGRFLALVMIALAGQLLWARRPRQVWQAAAALTVLWGGLVLTLSQSSFVALLAGLGVLAWMRFGWRWVAPPAAAAVVVGLVLVLAFPGTLRLDLGSSEALDDATSGRVGLIRGGGELALDRPILGWGSGSFAEEFRRQDKGSGPDAVSASHNIPITVAAEQGLVGLAAYGAFLVLALVRLLHGASRWPPRAVIGACFVALVVHTWLYAAFLEDPITWTLLAVGAALAQAQRGSSPITSGRSEPSLPDGTPKRSIRSQSGRFSLRS
jgi:O-antigen ligase